VAGSAEHSVLAKHGLPGNLSCCKTVFQRVCWAMLGYQTSHSVGKQVLWKPMLRQNGVLGTP